MNWPILVILLLFMGLILLLLEIFIVPGFGPVGIGAILFLAAGAYAAWSKLSPIWAMVVTLASILSVIVSIIYFKKSGLANKLVLRRHIKDSASQDIHNQTKKKGEGGSIISVGEIGLTVCDLRPAGIAEFKTHRVNVLTDGIYIKKKAKVKITRIEGNRIFVEEVSEEHLR